MKDSGEESGVSPSRILPNSNPWFSTGLPGHLGRPTRVYALLPPELRSRALSARFHGSVLRQSVMSPGRVRLLVPTFNRFVPLFAAFRQRFRSIRRRCLRASSGAARRSTSRGDCGRRFTGDGSERFTRGGGGGFIGRGGVGLAVGGGARSTGRDCLRSSGNASMRSATSSVIGGSMVRIYRKPHEPVSGPQFDADPSGVRPENLLAALARMDP